MNALPWNGLESTSWLGCLGGAWAADGKKRPGWSNMTLPDKARSAQSLACLFWSSASVMFPQEGVTSTSAGQGFTAVCGVNPQKRECEPLEGKSSRWPRGSSPALTAKGISSSRSSSTGSVFPAKLQRQMVLTPATLAGADTHLV